MNCKNLLATLIASLLLVVSAKAQQTENMLKPGQQCPDFKFNNVEHYSKNKVSLSDFKGKWLILDFWNRTCSVCIKGFPKLNDLQNEFGNKLQVLLVGINNYKYNKDIKGLFERIRVRQSLTLPIAYDSVMVNQLNVKTVPYIVVIDPKGIVRALPKSGELNSEMLRVLMNNETAGLMLKDSRVGETPFFYRSELSKWNKEIPKYTYYDIERGVLKGKYVTNALSLADLYNVAYFGKTRWTDTDTLYGTVSRMPVLELDNPEPFKYDFYKEKGFYNYVLEVPKEKLNRAYLQFAMQCDLKKYFGYKVELEQRDMPCWMLTVTADAARNLRSKATAISTKADHAGFTYKKVKISKVLGKIYSYHQNEAPFFDMTNITYDIDLTIEADLTNLEDLRKVLAKQGIVLVKANKLMTVLVISDPKS